MDTLNRNFYVGDLLKSVKDVKTAIRLLHDVINMCADGGFRLTKFVSNWGAWFNSREQKEVSGTGQRQY